MAESTEPPSTASKNAQHSQLSLNSLIVSALSPLSASWMVEGLAHDADSVHADDDSKPLRRTTTMLHNPSSISTTAHRRTLGRRCIESSNDMGDHVSPQRCDESTASPHHRSGCWPASNTARIIRLTVAGSVAHAATSRAKSESASPTEINRPQPFSALSVATIGATTLGNLFFSWCWQRIANPSRVGSTPTDASESSVLRKASFPAGR